MDSIQLVEESILASLPQSSTISVQNLQRLNQTRSGYTHIEIDQAALSLIQKFTEIAESKLKENTQGLEDLVDIETVKLATTYYKVLADEYRATKVDPVGYDTGGLRIQLTTKTLPKNVWIERHYGVVVPKDSGLDDDVIIQTADYQKHTSNSENKSIFKVRVSELLPSLSAATLMRLDILIQRIINESLAKLEQSAREALGKFDD